jgi:hypothetical protein
LKARCNRHHHGAVPVDVKRRTFIRTGGGLAATLLADSCTANGRQAVASTGTALSRSAARASPANWAALARGLDGRLIRPDEAAYNSARLLA